MPSKIESFLAQEEIKSLVIRERYYRDTSQWEKLRNAWHQDVSKTRIKISWFDGNIDGFLDGSKRMMKSSVQQSSHAICPVEVHLDGNRAVSESTGNIMGRFAYEGADYDCLSFGRFISRLEHDGNEWKLCSLELIYQKDSLIPVIPGPCSIKLDPSTRASYRCLGWLLEKGGFPVSQDLPGVDKPGSGEALMESCFKWLHGGD